MSAKGGRPLQTGGGVEARRLDESRRDDIRNVAVIAHVDHGKTTLVDAMLRQSGLLRQSSEEAERVLDSNDLERERGITILAKNTAVDYLGTRINILDTPGHHDFGGEVERMLIMADGVLLLVDAAEGPLPQTRFVLGKALDLGLAPIVVINKIDRKDARCDEVLDGIYELFIELGGDDANIDFPVLYTDGRRGIAHWELGDDCADLRPLFETILDEVPAPLDRADESLTMHANNLGWDDYVGRLVIGRVLSGTLRAGQQVTVHGEGGAVRSGRVMRLYAAKGLTRVEVEQARAGDIVSVAGIEEVAIGDTLSDSPETVPLPRIAVDQPTLAMSFGVNTGPFAGEDGTYITSRKLRERLLREARMNVAIQVEETDSSDVFRVIGRGELQLAVLAETMRRESFELALSRPEVVTREIDGQMHEPMERLYIDCSVETLGAISELIGPRKAKMADMVTGETRARLEYTIPTRGLIGFHSEFLTETRGTGIINTTFEGWIPWQGPIPGRRTGALVADRQGKATPYALFHLQPRGILFIEPGTRVYEGMLIGETPSQKNIDVNVTREKKLTNIRAAAKDDNVILSRPKKMTLESWIEFIDEDELIEVTPNYMRVRKRILSAGRRHKKAHGKGH
ncbi:MAG: translational GTPase TypA [Deltaproteobacteria bacterium]|nr:translational GTPase TypA [Deltaproteobacteria bacterium]